MYKFFIYLVLLIMVNSCTMIQPIKTVIVHGTEKLEKIIEKSRKVIYFVRVRINKSDLYSFGTAFVVSKNGLLATAFHVINNKKPVEVDVLIRDNGCEVFKKARWIIAKKHRDLAILYVDHKFKYVAKFRTTDLVSGEFLYSVGHPDAFNILRDDKYYPSIVSYGNFFRYIMYTQVPAINNTRVQLSTIPIRGGSSGSPVFDKDGSIVGTNFGVISEKNDHALTISVPIKYLTDLFIPQLQ